MAHNGGPSYEMLRAATPGVDAHPASGDNSRGPSPSHETSALGITAPYDPADGGLPSSSQHARLPSSSDENPTTAKTSQEDADITDTGSANNRDSMFPSGVGEDGLFLHDETQRRFFGAAASEGLFANRGSFASGSGVSTPGMRASYAGALYDSDDGSAVGLAPMSGANAGNTLSSADIAERYRDLPYTPASPSRLGAAGAAGGDVGTPFLDEKTTGGLNDRAGDSYFPRSKQPWYRQRKFILAGALGLIALIVVIAVPVALTTKKGHSSSDASTGTGGGGGGDGGGDNGGGSGGGGNNGTDTGGGGGPTAAPITGGDGSTVTTDKNTTFTYKNAFGGFWVDDPNDPFNFNAQAQSWIPPLNQSWNFAKNRIFGVNLGGWLVLEPFITPAYFEKYKGAVDEWTLSELIAADPNSGGLQAFLENHYDTFITEADFANIAGAGLGWVRIPIPFWAIETRGAEPFLEGIAWKYFLKACQWARKYGIRINLDLHVMPGSQNGFNHSGRLGLINFLNGYMGIANAQRGLEYIRVLTEFISQPEYSHVALWSFMNEAKMATIGEDILSHFYLQVHDMIRGITGKGAGNGPYMAFHDGFQGVSHWGGFMAGADRLVLDSHPYLCFVDQDTDPLSAQTQKPCGAWGAGFNNSLDTYGVTIAGEWAMSFNDCGKWLNGVGLGTRWEGTFPGYAGPVGGSCDEWTEWQKYSSSTKKSLLAFAKSSMDALPHWFFWTWKIGNSSITNSVEAPMWSYSLGLQQGWIPKDPRSSVGACGDSDPFDGTFPAYATGGKSAGTVTATFREEFSAWPPASLSGVDDIAYAPTYTATGAMPTLSAPVFTMLNGSTVSGGSGWFDSSDNSAAPVNITGCKYPDPWAQTVIPEPTTTCGGGKGARRRAPMPMRTEPPAVAKRRN